MHNDATRKGWACGSRSGMCRRRNQGVASLLPRLGRGSVRRRLIWQPGTADSHRDDSDLAGRPSCPLPGQRQAPRGRTTSRSSHPSQPDARASLPPPLAARPCGCRTCALAPPARPLAASAKPTAAPCTRGAAVAAAAPQAAGSHTSAASAPAVKTSAAAVRAAGPPARSQDGLGRTLSSESHPGRQPVPSIHPSP